MTLMIKICGLRDSGAAIAAAAAGADMLGFVFYAKSPRAVTPDAAEEIITEVKQAADEQGFEMPRIAGLFVDAGEKQLAEAAHLLSHFQFHGTEAPKRVAALGAEFGIETIKALPVSTAADLGLAGEFADAADMLLFDARPPRGADRPGGHGAVFDWALLDGYGAPTPYLVAGGLDPGNVAAAIAAQNNAAAFSGVDVSSGVETAPGRKDPEKIRAFVAAARAAAV